MATPRRRSARLSRKSSTPDRLSARKTPLPHIQLGSLVERDETPEGGPQSTLDTIVSSPRAPADAKTHEQLNQLYAVKTPKTLPRLAHAEMHPKEVHQTTTNAPDSGLRLGFADISPTKTSNTLADAQNTPTKRAPRASLPHHLTAAGFDFKFASESHLSEEAQMLMNNVREDAERIKMHILAEKGTQARKDDEAKRLFGGVSATGRKMAKPQGKAGRFSDVHMAQFKKMDSIANHPSSFRAKPNFAQPTQQSLKRSGSKAGLDEAERPQTAGKGTLGKSAPLFGQTNTSSNPQKPLYSLLMESNRLDNDAPAKRRKSIFGDVSAGRAAMKDDEDAVSRSSTLPRPKGGLPASLLTPTKASLARSNTAKIPLASPGKVSLVPRSNSVKSLKAADIMNSSSDSPEQSSSPPKQVGLVRLESTKCMRPLPPLPTNALSSPAKSSNIPTSKPLPAIPSLALSPGKPSLSSRLPTFQGLKSILRPTRRGIGKTIQSPTKDTSAGDTPKRPNTAAPSESDSIKKVDFTPSTKSRYAVKLAAASPSPSKLPQADPIGRSGPLSPYDPAAYTLSESSNDDAGEDEWEDAESEVDYPVLPLAASNNNTSARDFTAKAKDHSRRESKEFKSIFTTLEHPSRSNTPTTLTDVNTKVNVRGAGVIPPYQQQKQQANVVARSPSSNVNNMRYTVSAKPSPSTIRKVRSSGVSELVQPFEDTIRTVPHGLPGKKRRRELDDEGDDAKENRRASIMPNVPGAWDNGHWEGKVVDVDEGEKRGGKRAKIQPKQTEKEVGQTAAGKVLKKPNKAREAAAKNAKDRKSGFSGQTQAQAQKQKQNLGKGGEEKEKASGGGRVSGASGRGILSMSRLNMLSRPKERR
ncbi:hypothetical protein EPUS_05710 [Endocarpon pusillum Z07020]|uniref:Uncharacterized protein n=1 Tax=Endocarpon pusillum (strain Z07020 / HMAS-L-300199) TaxID=1263415 RepID=U1GLB7_ENDPU|nr:uncharacterized protein EPUS_05710 [Endocarpon pusillum Z07020]ERF72656.1 hypothetical protein EPUS_05710 [Endocarpon pusillum Z07020]